MKRIIFLILITIITFNIFNYSTIDSFAAKKKNKKQEIEKVSALIISETEEVEFDEPEIDEIIDGLEMHGSPMSEEVSNIEPFTGPGMSKSNKEQKFDYIPTANNLNISNERQKLLEYALRFLGGKYKFGGNTIDGFDCSGFTQYIYKQSLGKKKKKKKKKK